MNRKLAIFVLLMMIAAALTGCAGTTVVYQTDCDCPQEHSAENTIAEGERTELPAEGAVKTGLAIVGGASGEDAASVEFDASIVAVTVDDAGVITSCMIDSLGATVEIDAAGAVISDTATAVQTKNELGDSYGMKAYAGSKYEWYEQAAALADYAVGKTVDELKNGAVDESGKAPEGSDLASTATIYLGGYVSAIEEAVKNAQHLGAQAGDVLRYAVNASLADSTAAADGAEGLAQLNIDAAALTEKDGVITSCMLDSLQGKVNFDASGVITTDLAAPMQTKNQLGEAYGMKAYAGAKYEWNEQAENFAAYVTGKTAAEVSGIAVAEGKPYDADLSASVTIKIGGFQSLIEKAMN